MPIDLAKQRQEDLKAPPAAGSASEGTQSSARSSLRSSLKGLPYSRQLEALSPRRETRHATSSPTHAPNLLDSAAGKSTPSVDSSLENGGLSQRTSNIATPELLAFVAEPHAIANYQPSTGYGLFDATYDPVKQELVVAVRCAFRFLGGLPAEFPNVSTAELAWDDDSKAAWRKGFIDLIVARWSGGHAFRCSRPGLGSLRANVRVDIVESEKDWHFRMDVTRIPKGRWTGSSVTTHAGAGVEKNFATLDSEDLTKTPKGGSEGQFGAVHEFGHMVGLGDQYGSGTDIAHRALVKDALGTEISKGTSDDVMSCANQIEIQDYVTFLEALKKTTEVDEWGFE